MKKRIQILLGFIAMFVFTQVAKAQASAPFTIVNHRTCDIIVSFEVSDCIGNNPMCVYSSSSPTFSIPGGGSYVITAAACPNFSSPSADVFVYFWDIGGQDISSDWATVSNVCCGGCLASQGNTYVYKSVPNTFM